jgi:hypothetical protein
MVQPHEGDVARRPAGRPNELKSPATDTVLVELPSIEHDLTLPSPHGRLRCADPVLPNDTASPWFATVDDPI